ncbi:MAG: hypothetical protein KF784_03655 [Fimbriimonadaceae bacterium]|nr:hypothetical protein [Fimbriimonadaceae bacterium]
MKRFLFAYAVFLVCGLAGAQAKLNVLQGTKTIGTANVTQRLNADGTKLVQLSLELVNGQTKVKIRQESTYTAKGEPIRSFQEVTGENPRVSRRVVVTFDEEGANVVIDEGGKRETKQLTLAKAAPRGQLAEFWFLRDKPKAGTTVEAYRFNMDKLEWQIARTTYVGPKTLTINGKQVKCHELKSTDGVSWVDEKGLPVRADYSGVRFEAAGS